MWSQRLDVEMIECDSFLLPVALDVHSAIVSMARMFRERCASPLFDGQGMVPREKVVAAGK
jgi:hypothetical protein